MTAEISRDELINEGLSLFGKHFNPCDPGQEDNSLTPEAVIQIFSNAFDQEAVQLQKHEVNQILESSGYKSRMVGKTLYWMCRSRR